MNLSGPESLRSAELRFLCFFFAILGRGAGFKRMEKPHRYSRDILDCGYERGFVRLGRLIETADLSHKLKRCRSNLFLGYGRIEVEKSFDITAHDNYFPTE
jgi:hypothetical protein